MTHPTPTQPHQAKAAYLRGNWAEAERMCRAVLNEQPDNFDALNILGIISAQKQQLPDAIDWLSRAIQATPNCAMEKHDFEAALRELKRCHHAHWNLAQCYLQSGNLSRGWQEHEWRWSVEELGVSRPDINQPLWLGKESLSGKTILLHSEQGLGDTIQFCRYVKKVSALGARTILMAEPHLLPLLASLSGVDQVFSKGSDLPQFDFHCPLGSLPLAFETELDTIPAEIPYLRSDTKRLAEWRQRLGSSAKPRIGYAWSGNIKHANDRNRSLALSKILPLMPDWAEAVSLQKEARPGDATLLTQRPDIRHFGESLADFADTAALVDLMDLVITVDTSVAHLAGAMGKPVWLLLPFNSDWRWLLNRKDSPWYPTARLFRQPAIGDWQSVIDQVSQELTCAQMHRLDDTRVISTVGTVSHQSSPALRPAPRKPYTLMQQVRTALIFAIAIITSAVLYLWLR